MTGDGLALDLIEADGVEEERDFGRYDEGGVDEFGFIDGAIAREELDLAGGHLVALPPKDGRMVHGSNGVARIEDEGIAAALQIGAEKFNVAIGLDEAGAVGRNWLDVEGVGVHKERVAAVDLARLSSFCGHCLTAYLVIKSIISKDRHSVDAIGEHHIASGGAEAGHSIVENLIANEGVRTRDDRVVLVELRLLGDGVIPAAFGLYNSRIVVVNGCLTKNPNHLGMSIITHRIAIHGAGGRSADDIIFEIYFVGVGIIDAIARGELIVVVDDAATVVEIGFVEQAVVVEKFGVEPRLAFVGTDVIAHFCKILITKINEMIAVEVNGVVLDDMDAAVSDDNIGIVVHIGAIAMQDSAAMREDDTTIERLSVFADFIVVAEEIGALNLDLQMSLLRNECGRSEEKNYG